MPASLAGRICVLQAAQMRCSRPRFASHTPCDRPVSKGQVQAWKAIASHRTSSTSSSPAEAQHLRMPYSIGTVAQPLGCWAAMPPVAASPGQEHAAEIGIKAERSNVDRLPSMYKHAAGLPRRSVTITQPGQDRLPAWKARRVAVTALLPLIKQMRNFARDTVCACDGREKTPS